MGRCLSFSDKVLVLDDRSTDNTPKIAKRLGCEVRHRGLNTPAWGAEAPARQELWELGLEYVTEWDDWLLICDADMELHGDPRPLCETQDLNSWAWPLFDMWSETEYRSDGFWRGHEVPRVWMVAPRRVPDGWVAEWPERGIHCGHIPNNFPLLCGNSAILEHYWLHLAYSTPKLRAEKLAQYRAKAHLLTDFERAHAESIISLDPPAGL